MDRCSLYTIDRKNSVTQIAKGQSIYLCGAGPLWPEILRHTSNDRLRERYLAASSQHEWRLWAVFTGGGGI